MKQRNRVYVMLKRDDTYILQHKAVLNGSTNLFAR